MEEILHHLGCMKPCKQWDKLPTSTGAGFLSSTVACQTSALWCYIIEIGERMEIIMRDDPAKRNLFGWFSLGIVIILLKSLKSLIFRCYLLILLSTSRLRPILQPTKCVKPWGFLMIQPWSFMATVPQPSASGLGTRPLELFFGVLILILASWKHRCSGDAGVLGGSSHLVSGQ